MRDAPAGPRLSGQRVIHTTLWAAGLVYLNYLFALASGVYTWATASALHAIAVAGSIALLKLMRKPGDVPAREFAAPPFAHALNSRTVRLTFFAVLALTITGAMLNLRTPPGGWDALTYHLDFPAQWVLAGKIFPVLTAYGDYSPTYYPMLVEAFAGWYLLPLRGAAFADLVQLLFAPLLYIAARDLAYIYRDRAGEILRPPFAANKPEHTRAQADGETRSEASPVSVIAECAPLVILSLPYLQSSLLVADNDFVLCALLLAVWRGAARQGLTPTNFAATVPAALALTVKYTGLVYVGALAGVLLLAMLVATLRSIASRESQSSVMPTGDGRREARSTAGFVARICAAATVLVGGASPYLLNWETTGNPLYPATVTFLENTIFAGYYPRAFFLQHPFHQFDWLAFISNPGLSLPLYGFAAGTILLTIAAWAAAGAKRHANLIGFLLALMPVFVAVFIPAALFCAFYFFVPLRQFRLMLPALACSVAIFALLDLLAESVFAQLRQRFHRLTIRFPVRLPAPAVAIVVACFAVIALHCAVTVLRFAEVYGDPFPFEIHIALNEIARESAPQVLRDASRAAGTFAGLFGLVFVLVAAFATVLRANSPWTARRGRGIRTGVMIALLIGGLGLPAILAIEQQSVGYEGPGLPAAYRAIQALRSGETPANWPDGDAPPQEISGGIGVVGTNALLPFRARRPADRYSSQDAQRSARPPEPEPAHPGRVYLLLNRPGGDRPLHLREESLRHDAEAGGWVAIGTLAYRDLFNANLERHDIRTMILATTIGTNGKWPAEYEWLHQRPGQWNCGLEISNAISGDPGARIAVCLRTGADDHKKRL